MTMTFPHFIKHSRLMYFFMSKIEAIYNIRAFPLVRARLPCGFHNTVNIDRPTLYRKKLAHCRSGSCHRKRKPCNTPFAKKKRKENRLESLVPCRDCNLSEFIPFRRIEPSIGQTDLSASNRFVVDN